MQNRRLPYLFLLLLIFIIIFILGLRRGIEVEKTNKKMNYILSITQTRPTIISPSPYPPVNYLTFQHKGCGLRFLYPSSLEKTKETTTSAQLQSSVGEVLEFTCEKSDTITPTVVDEKIATESVTLVNQQVTAVKKTVDNRIENLDITIKNTQKNIPVRIQISKTLLPLFERTLEFIK
jgi:hypothetical protein